MSYFVFCHVSFSGLIGMIWKVHYFDIISTVIVSFKKKIISLKNPENLNKISHCV